MTDYTQDNFLGGRIRLKQFSSGYRATSDSVLLAAAVDAKVGESVLDVGAGNGVVALCVAARVGRLDLTGIEIQSKLADLAKENALINNLPMRIVCQDIAQKQDALHGQQYHHVITNPPFYTETCQRDDKQQKIAFSQQIPMDVWIRYCLKHLRPKGVFTMIHRIEALPSILSVLNNCLGALEVIPIQSKANKSGQRMIVRGVLGSKRRFELKPAFIMHNSNGKYTMRAENILRNAKTLF